MLSNKYLRQLQVLYISIALMVFFPWLALIVMGTSLYFIITSQNPSPERVYAIRLLKHLLGVLLAVLIGLIVQRLGMGKLLVYLAYVWLAYLVSVNIWRLQKQVKN